MTKIDHIPEPTGAPEPYAPAPGPDDDHHREKLIRLGLVAAGLVVLSLLTNTWAIAVFVVAVIAIIMLHELGHFVTAKKSGMKVTEYFLGFGPRLWSVRRGETEYGIKAIPLGGYVKIVGMNNMERDIDPVDEPRTYRQQSYGKRVVVAMAGIVTHFVIAFLLLVLLWTVIGLPSANTAQLAKVLPGSAAERGGLKAGDVILSADGRTGWSKIRDYVRSKPDQPVTFVVSRDGAKVSVPVTPAASTPEGEHTGFLGVEAAAKSETVNPVVAAGRSGQMLANMTGASVEALGSFFSPESIGHYADLVAGEKTTNPAKVGTASDPNANRPLSLVGVGRLADQAAETGWSHVVELLVILNVFIAVFNLIPLLPFDGGHVAIATYERLRSRKQRRYHADVSKMMPVTAIVFALVVTLGVTSIYLDIFNPVANPFH